MNYIKLSLSVVMLSVCLCSLYACEDEPQRSMERESGAESAPDLGEADLGSPDVSPDVSPDMSPDMSSDMSSDMGAPEVVYPNQPGGDPLDPTHPLYPYPSDFFLIDDPEMVTGLRIEIPEEAALRGVPLDLLTRQDGFSRLPMILSGWPRGVDASSLPSPVEHGESIAPDSTTLIIEHETGRLIPHLAEVDRTSRDPISAPLILRPLFALEPNRGYSVVIRDQLRDLEGARYEAGAAFAALRDHVAAGEAVHDELLTRWRARFEVTRALIEAQGVPLDEVILAWSFHTRSREQGTGQLLRLQERAHEWPLVSYEVTVDEVRGENRQLEGVFIAPLFAGPQGLELDGQGEARELALTEVPFTLTIPLSVDSREGDQAPEARPALLYGHGFLGERQQATRSSFNALCRRARISATGINFGFHNDLFRDMVLGIGGDRDAILRLSAGVMQTMVNGSLMVRYMREQLSLEYPIDPDSIYYMGISNGGTFGHLFGATTLEVERGVFVVGGGGLSHFLQRATQWNELGYLAANLHGDAPSLQLFLSQIQQILDEVDPINYVDRLVEPRFSGRPPLRSQLHMAVHDSQVNNLVTEWVARTAGVPLITPSPKEIWGLDTVSAPLSDEQALSLKSALYVYDEGVEPSPVENIPPAEDNRTHNTVRELDVYQEHIVRFINEGRIQQVCDGPCDPE